MALGIIIFHQILRLVCIWLGIIHSKDTSCFPSFLNWFIFITFCSQICSFSNVPHAIFYKATYASHNSGFDLCLRIWQPAYSACLRILSMRQLSESRWVVAQMSLPVSIIILGSGSYQQTQMFYHYVSLTGMSFLSMEGLRRLQVPILMTEKVWLWKPTQVKHRFLRVESTSSWCLSGGLGRFPLPTAICCVCELIQIKSLCSISFTWKDQYAPQMYSEMISKSQISRLSFGKQRLTYSSERPCCPRIDLGLY